MNYEAWRISYQSSEQAARAAFEMYTKAHQKVLELAEENVTLVDKLGWGSAAYSDLALEKEALEHSKEKAVRDAIISALRLYGEPTLSPSEIEALAERYVQNMIVKQPQRDIGGFSDWCKLNDPLESVR